ncbi:MAG: hypothetical protein AB1898_19120 [Acidobacteriota bacterium]
MTRVRVVLITAMAVFVGMRCLQPVLGCGPWLPTAYFTFSYHPFDERYFNGRLGVLQPTYWRIYLYAAYRYLSEPNLSGDPAGVRPATRQGNEQNWVTAWLTARRSIRPDDPLPQIDVYRETQPYRYYLNYPEDAFRNAVQTLEQRISQFGADSREVAEWLKAQDIVFSNQTGQNRIPEPAPKDLPPVIRADRDYQIAAAYFYAGNFDEAAARFRAIATDSDSPWRSWAPYLVARCFVRKSALMGEEDAWDSQTLAQAESQLRSVLQNPQLEPVHKPSQKLLNLVSVRLHPAQRSLELARNLRLINLSQVRYSEPQELIDYRFLLDRLLDLGGSSLVGSAEETLAVARQDDMTDWIVTFQDSSSSAREHTVERWRQTQSEAWLVSALVKASVNHPALPELLRAARQVSSNSRAYPSVMFHRFRLMMERGEGAETRREMDGLLPEAEVEWPRSSLNLLLGMRLKLATTFDEFLKFAVRVPAGVGTSDSEGGFGEVNEHAREPMFHADSARILNDGLPTRKLLDAAKSDQLSPVLREKVALAAWVRAVLLDQEPTALELAAWLEQRRPDFRDSFRAYQTEPTPGARKFAAVLLILKTPGLRPLIEVGLGRQEPVTEMSIYRDNWWCPGDQWPYSQHVEDLRDPLRVLYLNGQTVTPPFLNEQELEQAGKEREALETMSTAPNYLCRQVVEWVRRNPKDPRAAEALHLAVRSTRRGCGDRDTGKFSRDAFRLLHRLYPDSPWARKTKYWYGSLG